VHLALGHAVVALGAVARGVDAVDRGLLAAVDADGAPDAGLQPRVGGEAGVGRDAEPEHDDVGPDRAGRGVDDPVLEPLGLHAQADVDPELAQRRGDRRRHVRVHRAHHLLVGLDQGDLHPPAQERLGHLHADVAAADHHRGLAAAALGVLEQVDAVVEGLDAVDVGAVDAGQRRADRAGAGGDVQQVEPELQRAVPGVVAHLDLPGRQIDADGLVAHPDVDALAVPELLGRAGDQLLVGADVAGDEVGDATGRVAGPATALEGDDLHVGLLPAGLRRRRHAAGVTADHQESFGHGAGG